MGRLTKEQRACELDAARLNMALGRSGHNAIAIRGDAVTLPILEIVLNGKLTGPRLVLGEGMATKQGVYQLTHIGCPELHGANEVGILFKWQRLGNLP